MKKAKLKVNLALVCSLLLPSTVAIASTNSTNEQDLTILNMLSAEPFFADSKVKLTFRNMWKYLKTEDGKTDYKTVAQAWGQGIALDYESGYFKDFIGVDISYYGGVKLAASDNFSSRAILYNNNGHAEGYNKIGQRYVKFKLDFDAVRFDAKAGWQVMKNIGILTSSTRMSINSYQGWYGKATIDNVFAEVAYVTGTSRRDSPDKVRLKGAGKVIDHLWTGGLTYKDKNTTVAYFYGDADDYVRQHGLETTFKAMPKLTVRTQIYAQIAGDDMKTYKSRAFDDKAWHYAADAKWTEPDWSLKVGVAYTDADKSGDNLGYYSRNIISNSRGRFNSTAYADIDYTRDGELYFSVDYGYKLLPDYTVGIRGMYGQLSYKGNSINSNAVTLYNVWNPTSIKNLSLYADLGYGWHYKNSNRTPILNSKGDFQRAHSLSGSMTLAYSFNIL